MIIKWQKVQDPFKIKPGKPSNLKHRRRTWEIRKHHESDSLHLTQSVSLFNFQLDNGIHLIHHNPVQVNKYTLGHLLKSDGLLATS